MAKIVRLKGSSPNVITDLTNLMKPFGTSGFYWYGYNDPATGRWMVYILKDTTDDFFMGIVSGNSIGGTGDDQKPAPYPGLPVAGMMWAGIYTISAPFNVRDEAPWPMMAE